MTRPGPERSAWFAGVRRALICVCLLCGVGAGAAAQQPAVAALAEPPPSAVAEPLRGRLAESGTRVTVGDAELDFWWVVTLPQGDGAGFSELVGPWAHVPEGALVGAVRISRDFPDIRGRVVPAGVYTLRFGVQPANGDHLGVSPYREFLLLVAAATDADPAPTGYDATVKLSAQVIGSAHPAAFSLDPPEAPGPALGVQENDVGHLAVLFEIPVRDADPLIFGLIVVGKVEA